ncbi:hypothetical protein L195_g057370, partial [Trifolium pratense]
ASWWNWKPRSYMNAADASWWNWKPPSLHMNAADASWWNWKPHSLHMNAAASLFIATSYSYKYNGMKLCIFVSNFNRDATQPPPCTVQNYLVISNAIGLMQHNFTYTTFRTKTGPRYIDRRKYLSGLHSLISCLNH